MRRNVVASFSICLIGTLCIGMLWRLVRQRERAPMPPVTLSYGQWARAREYRLGATAGGGVGATSGVRGFDTAATEMPRAKQSKPPASWTSISSKSGGFGATESEVAPLLRGAELREINPKLVDGLYKAAKEKPGEIHIRWKDCEQAYAARHGGKVEQLVEVKYAITYRSSGGYAEVIKIEHLEGGDEEAVQCFWRISSWMHEPFPAPGAKDGIFRHEWKFHIRPDSELGLSQ